MAAGATACVVGDASRRGPLAAEWFAETVSHLLLPALARHPAESAKIELAAGSSNWADIRPIRAGAAAIETVRLGLADGSLRSARAVGVAAEGSASDEEIAHVDVVYDPPDYFPESLVLRCGMLARQPADLTEGGKSLRSVLSKIASQVDYAHVDRAMEELSTPYELENSISLPACYFLADRFARGAFWLNLLGERHIAALGGLEHILECAPCDQRSPLAGGSRVLLGFDTPLGATPSHRLKALEAFLSPVLLTSAEAMRILAEEDWKNASR